MPMMRWGTLLAVCAISLASLAQTPNSEGASQPRLIIARLPHASYPPIALAARVSGNVTLSLTLRHDGSVKSATVTDGPPMLRDAALALVHQTAFQCDGCTNAMTNFHFKVRFEFAKLANSLQCGESDPSYPRIARSGDSMTITDRPMGVCADPGTIEPVRVRSIKCLFLWKCDSVSPPTKPPPQP
jgi:TonB family protein